MDGIQWATSAMEAAQARLDIATNNLANSSTDGYRRQAARGFLVHSGARVAAVTSSDHGALRRTGRPYDLAIVGDGSFHVRDPHGVITSTRNGAFVLDRDGHLCDAAGRTLLTAHGAPLRIAAGAKVTAAEIGLPASSSLQTGALESSSVDAISEMIDVLSAQRAYEGAEKTVSAIDETRRQSADAARVKG
jgi:flagellar basal body rod protein FlgG